MKRLTVRAAGGDLALSKIILGACNFGTWVNQETSLRLLDEYVRLGGDTIDTASVYGDWDDKGTPVSEQLLGEWMQENGNRERLTVITKGGHYRLKQPNISRATPECVKADIEKSLHALRTDYIDVYFLHRDNLAVPVEAFIDVLDEAVKAGKIRATGASNWTVERIRQANEYAVRAGKTPFTVSEIQWSLAHASQVRDAVDDLHPMTEEDYQRYLAMELPVLAWSSQAGGVITKILEHGTETLKEGLKKQYLNDTTLRSVALVKELCVQQGITPTQAALGYIICNRLPGAAIIGPNNLEQLADSMKAMDLTLPPEAVEHLKWR